MPKKRSIIDFLKVFSWLTPFLTPNETTLKAMEELEKGENVKKFETAEEFFEDLGI